MKKPMKKKMPPKNGKPMNGKKNGKNGMNGLTPAQKKLPPALHFHNVFHLFRFAGFLCHKTQNKIRK